MERLQGIQSAAAMWLLQVRRRDWSLRGGLKKLGWLSICQQAAYQSVKIAIQILQKKSPERLYKSLTHIQDGQRVRKVWKEVDLMKLNLSTRKAWSTRALRWIEMMPDSMKQLDLSYKSSRQALKGWIKHRVPPRGDKVLWGKPLREAGAQGGEAGGQGGGPGGGHHVDLVREEEEQDIARNRGAEGVEDQEVVREGIQGGLI